MEQLQQQQKNPLYTAKDTHSSKEAADRTEKIFTSYIFDREDRCLKCKKDLKN